MVQAAEAEKSCVSRRTRARCGLSWSPSPETAVPWCGIVMITLGQLTGINAVMYYLSTLMGRIGFSTKNSVFMSLLVAGRCLLVPFQLVHGPSLVVVWGTTLLGSSLGWCWLVLDTRLTLKQTWLLLKVSISLVLFCTWAFRVVRLFDMGCARRVVFVGDQITRYDYLSALLYLWAFTVTYNFNRMKVAMTYTGLTIGFYGGIAFLGFFYQVLFMPNQGKTLEEIDEIFPSRQLIKENLSGLKRFWGR